MKSNFLIISSLILSVGFQLLAQQKVMELPHLHENVKSAQLIVHGKPFIMLAGELSNSTSSSMSYMDSIMPHLKALNLNTVLAAVSWEMIEPVEGQFDFSNVDGHISKARKNNLKLVMLWFGTWKNACSSYAPAWVRQDTKRFVRSEDLAGAKLNNLSALCSATCEADSKAFAALMKHLKEVDGVQNTVLAVQVENEPGIRGDSREHSALANEAFNKPVPIELMHYLIENKEKLTPDFLQIWAKSFYKKEGTWTEVFDGEADMVFMSWNTASYINKVAAAGKAVYPLPMYTNAWLGNNESAKAGTFPSGGCVPRVFPIWKAAAPSIDILSPDIYRKEFASTCNLYQRMNNPLFIPETGYFTHANVFYAIGQGAICFSPFGIEEYYPITDPIGKSYQLLTNLMPYLLQYQGAGKMVGVVGKKDEKQEISLGDYKLQISFLGGSKGETPSGAIIISLANDEFLVAGSGLSVTFLSGENKPKRTEILKAYELVYKNKSWEKQRRLNGDETGNGSDHGIQLQFKDDNLGVKTAKVFSYE